MKIFGRKYQFHEFSLPVAVLTTRSMNSHYQLLFSLPAQNFRPNISHTPWHFSTFFIEENVFKFRGFSYDLEIVETFGNEDS